MKNPPHPGDLIRTEIVEAFGLTVTGKWRLVFRYGEQTNTASDIDLIDYH